MKLLLAVALFSAHAAFGACQEVCTTEQSWTGYGWSENERCDFQCGDGGAGAPTGNQSVARSATPKMPLKGSKAVIAGGDSR